MSVPKEEAASSGRRTPERGKPGFATVSSTYIRRARGIGKQALADANRNVCGARDRACLWRADTVSANFKQNVTNLLSHLQIVGW